VLVASVTLATGCGVPTANPGEVAPSVPISMMPTASDFVSSVIRTRDLGTADLEVQVESQVDGRQQRLAGSGGSSLGEGLGDMEWTQGDTRFRELSNDVAVFVQTPPGADRWTRLAKGEVTQTTGFADPLRGLGVLQSVTDEGTEPVGDITARRYSGQVPADASALRALGLTQDSIDAIQAAGATAPITVTAWVDPAGRVVRVVRSYNSSSGSGPHVSVTSTTDLSDFSRELNLQSPPSASVTTQSPTG
jgi:hypothetical protein